MDLESKIIVVDDDPMVLDMVSTGLRHHGFSILRAENPAEALALAEKETLSVALVDFDLGWPEMDGIDLGRDLVRIYSHLIVVIITGYQNIKTVVDATQRYGFNHMIKPFRIDQILSLIERADKEANLKRENAELKAELARLREDNQKLTDLIKEVIPNQARMPHKTDTKAVVKSTMGKQAILSYEKQKEKRRQTREIKKLESPGDID